MKQRVVLAIVAVVLMASLGCALFSGRETREGAAPVSGGATSSGDFEITVVNQSPDEVCYVLISSSDSDQWGADWLNNDERIGPGQRRAFTVSAGEHDIQLEACDQAVMATGWSIVRATTFTVGDSGATSRLYVDNTSESEVCYIYISASTGEDWGEDWLGESETIMMGRTRVFYVRPDIYDLMARDCNDESLAEQYEVDLSSDMTWTLYNE